MRTRTPFCSRRDVVAGIGSALLWAAAKPAVAQGPSGTPIRIGQTLALTGPFAQTGLVHQIVGEIFVERLNRTGGLLSRPVEYVLLDDQSRPDLTRTLYERLITSDNVDLILGPYGTASILAAMGVAQRYHKVYIQNTLGTPALATYEWQFSALMLGAEPEKTIPERALDCYATTGHPPKTIAIITSKFPSTEFTSNGMRDVAKARGVEEVAFLEYDVGTRDFAPLASRVKDADPDLMFLGCLGVEGNQMLEALSQLNYSPRRHYYLFPSGLLAAYPPAERALSFTNFEDVAPFTSSPEGAEFAKAFDEKATKAGSPYPHVDGQAGNEYAGWQILVAAINATKSIDDKALATWLDQATVDTIEGRRNFKGKFHTSDTNEAEMRQVQNGRWVAVWPEAGATPGAKLIAP